MDARELEERHGGSLMRRRPTAAMVRGRGSTLVDEEGTSYLDLTSGYGVALLGHAHPAVATALAEQAAALVSCPGNLYCRERSRLLAALAAAMPPGLDRFFLCNSGAEAIEAALKFARVATGRSRWVAVKGGFHGRTAGALSVTWNPAARKPFEPLLGAVRFVARNHTAELERAVDDEVAVVVAEVIQGESGVHPLEDEFLRAASRLCRERGALLVIDEIQTGLGRTGAWLAHTAAEIEPDLVTLAKGIASGVPLGVTCYRQQVADRLEAGVHATTFGGNPLACRAASATLETLRAEELPVRAARLGESLLDALRQRLGACEVVREVRGRGLMVGIELRQKVGPVLDRLLREYRILALPAGSTVLRLLPPLVVTEAELERAVDAIGEVLER